MKLCINYETCNNYAMSNLDVCASCSTADRKQERDDKRNANKPKQKPIRKVSEKRKDKLLEYTPLRKKYLVDHPECEIKLFGCTYVSKEIHHVSMSDLDFLNISLWKATCPECHRFLETHLSAQDRKDMGLLL